MPEITTQPQVPDEKGQDWNLVYENIDNAETHLPAERRESLGAMLEGAADRNELKARMLNTAWMIDRFKPRDRRAYVENWQSVKSQFSKQFLGVEKPDISDMDLYNAIGGEMRKKRGEEKAAVATIGKMMQSAIAGEADWSKALEAAGGMEASPIRRDRYLTAASVAYQGMRARADAVRPLADNIGSILERAALLENESSGVGVMSPQWKDVRAKRVAIQNELAGFIDELAEMPDEDRALLYQVIARTANPREKGFAEQSVQSVERGLRHVMQNYKTILVDLPNIVAARDAASMADNIYIPAEGNRSFSQRDFSIEKDVIGAPWNYTANRDGNPAYRKLTDDEKENIRKTASKMEAMQKIKGELRGLSEGVIDPLKGDNFITEKIWYPALAQVGYTAQAFVPYAGIPMLLTSTAGMRADEMMRRGVSAEDALGLSVATAIPETAMEFLQSRLMLGKIPGLSKAFEIPASTVKKWALRTGATLATEVIGENATEAAQDLTPLVIQQLAATLSDSIPDVDWGKEFEGYGKERLDTFFALLPMVLIGTGAASARDYRYLKDATVLAGVGFNEKIANTILNAKTPEDQTLLVQAYFNDPQARNPNSPAAKAARGKIVAGLEQQAQAMRNGAKVLKMPDNTWTVAGINGQNIATGLNSEESAAEIKRKYDETDADKAAMEKTVMRNIANLRDDAFMAAEQQAAWEAQQATEAEELSEFEDVTDPDIDEYEAWWEQHLKEEEKLRQSPIGAKALREQLIEEEINAEFQAAEDENAGWETITIADEQIPFSVAKRASDLYRSIGSESGYMTEVRSHQKFRNIESVDAAVEALKEKYRGSFSGDFPDISETSWRKYRIIESMREKYRLLDDAVDEVRTWERAANSGKAKKGETAKKGKSKRAVIGMPGMPKAKNDAEANATLPNKASSFDEARAILKPIAGKVFTNRSSGIQGSISGRSINKILSGKSHAKSTSMKAHLHAAANIVTLFENGEILQSEPGRKGEVKTSHKAFAPFVFEGKPLVAKVTVHEYKHPGEGRIYSVEAIEILNPAVNSAPSGYQGQLSNPLPDSVMRRLREMAESVNPENANREGGDTLGSPLRARQPNAQAVNFDRPPDVRPGSGVNAPETIAAFSDIVKVAGGSGALRIGKLRKRKTLGEFWRNAAVSRVRVAGDVSTAAHELAHALDQAIFGAGNNWDSKTGLSGGEQADLGRLGRDLYGDKIPYGGYKKEGFAEFIRLYLTDPAQALAKAPRFRAWWESRILENNPALASAMRKAQSMGEMWFKQGSKERMARQIARLPGAREKLAGYRATASYRFQKAFIEGAVSLQDFVIEARQKASENTNDEGLGVDIMESKDPYAQLVARRLTADSKASHMATTAMIDFNGRIVGRPLVDAFNRAGGAARASDFVLYLWARRAIALWDDPKGSRNPGIDREDAAHVLAELESPDFAEAAQMVYDWNNGVLNYSAQASPAFAKAVDAIRARDPGSYIPLFREFKAIDERAAAAGAGGVRGRDLTKRLRGSGRRIKPPVESMLASAKRIIAKADQMHVLELAVNIAETVPGMGHLLTEVPRNMVPQLGPSIADQIKAIDAKLKEVGASLKIEAEDTDMADVDEVSEQALTFFTQAVIPKNGEYGYIPMLRDGKVRWYEIEKGLYETLAVMDSTPVPFGVFGQAMNFMARTKRIGTTAINAPFALFTNPPSASSARRPTLKALRLALNSARACPMPKMFTSSPTSLSGTGTASTGLPLFSSQVRVPQTKFPLLIEWHGHPAHVFDPQRHHSISWPLGFRVTSIINMTNISRFLICVFLFTFTHGLAHARESFDFGWRFAKGDHPGAEQAAFDDSTWRGVTLPHDWSIEGPYSEQAATGGPGGYLPTGAGWYRKTFHLPEGARGKRITVQFDGIHMDSTVWINGRELGTQPYGYTAFEYDLTPHLVFGKRDNVIAVRVDNSRQPNSRWYSGSGIYRRTWLRTTEPLHIPTWGVCVTTPEISDERAVVRARVEVRNDGPAARPARVLLAVLDASGSTVAEGVAGETSEIAKGGVREFTGEVVLPAPSRWSPDAPHLYRLRATVAPADGRGSDVLDTTFGVRTAEFDLNRGFILNGEKVIMRGMCLHHDGGAVGAAVPEAVLRRRLLLLKEMGCNAVRASHNPMAPEFYDLCDRLGLLVMDEIFDEWTARKPQIKFGYSDYYKDWHERDLVAFIRRNRNHPSIVIWSAGNEIGEQGDANGADVLRPLVEIFHREDPTRPVTAALDRAYTERGHAPEAFTGLLDVVGYNYVDRWGARRETHYADDRALFPRRKFIGTENVSARGERGSYLFGPLASGLAGAANPPQGALYPAATLRAQALWKFVAAHDYVAGDFAWTGFDYLGESRWPRKLSSSGPLDTCGFKKDTFYFYQSIWTAKPMIHLLPHWSWPGREGQIVPVLAFTNGNFAELFLNGRSLGVKAKEFPRQGTSGGWNSYARPSVQSSTTDLHFAWDVPYEPGELRAVVYDNAGAVVAEASVRTAGAPAALELSVDRNELAADARDVAHVTVRALDANGIFVPLADDEITFEISGPGKVIGVDNGDPASHASYQGNTRALHAGMALALVQSDAKPGTVRVVARAKGLREASVEIVTLP